MSGSGGGGYIPPKSTKFDCEGGILAITVSSVDIAVLNKHKIADVLNVLLSVTDTVILEDGNGEILGSVVHINTAELIQCIKDGNNYEAKITSINSPTCHIKINKM